MILPLVLTWVLYFIHWYQPPWYNKFIRACRFWSLVFMQGFDVESKTSEISSSSTLWQDLEATYNSCNEANLTPRSLGTKPEKMINSEDLPRKMLNLAGQGATSNSDRNWRQGPTCRRGKDLEDSGTNIRQRRQATRPGWAQAVRPSPFQSPVTSPFDLAAIQAIYRPGVESHASINSSSAAEEQRREGHHLGEERVELVD
jgi:hypothetical protein